MRQTVFGTLVAGLLLLAMTTAPVASGAGLGAPISSIDVNCTSETEVFGPPVAGTHPSTVARITVSAGSGDWGFLFPDDDFYPGDVTWVSGPELEANEAPSVEADGCDRAAFRVDVFDLPVAPVTYSGNSQRPSGDAGDTLFFDVPTEARFVADVNLTQGAIRVGNEPECGGCTSGQVFASPGLLSLGPVTPGLGQVPVEALDGPQARYSITIRALPVVISNLTFSQPIARPRAVLMASYSVDGQTTISALVRNGAGSVVRSLAQGLAVSADEHSLTWDGTDGAGNALPDGRYTLEMSSSDAYGGTSSAVAAVTLDGTPPVSVLTAPRSPAGALSVAVSDVGSAVAAGQVAVDANANGNYADASDLDAVVSPNSGSTTVVRPPTGGWRPGSVYNVRVRSSDRAGNSGESFSNFVVPPPQSAPPAPRVTISAPSRGARLGRDRRISVRLRNPNAFSLRTRITLTSTGRASRRLARTTILLRPNSTRTARVRVSRATARRIRRLGRMRLRITYSYREPTGSVRTFRRVMTVRPAR